MVKGHNRNKASQNHKVNPSQSVVDNEYDLEKNIKKINSYSRNRRSSKEKPHYHITDSGERENMNSRINDFIEAPHVPSNPILTGNLSAWDSYTRLDDKITDFNYKNDQAHTDLRKELESKIKDSINDCNNAISNLLPKQWYVWTIVGLVAIVGIWYMFSYIEVHPLPSKVNDINKRLHLIEKEIDKLTIDTIAPIKINKN